MPCHCCSSRPAHASGRGTARLQAHAVVQCATAACTHIWFNLMQIRNCVWQPPSTPYKLCCSVLVLNFMHHEAPVRPVDCLLLLHQLQLQPAEALQQLSPPAACHGSSSSLPGVGPLPRPHARDTLFPPLFFVSFLDGGQHLQAACSDAGQESCSLSQQLVEGSAQADAKRYPVAQRQACKSHQGLSAAAAACIELHSMWSVSTLHALH